MSNRSWMAMSMEMVSLRFRGEVDRVPHPPPEPAQGSRDAAGGYLYESGRPELVFIIPVVVDLFLRIPLLYTLPETMKKNPEAVRAAR